VAKDFNIEQIDSFIFYKSFEEAISQIPSEKEQLDVYKAIIRYGLYREAPEGMALLPSIVWTQARPQLDANFERLVNGRKGGRPPKDKPTVNENENQRFSNKEPNANENNNSNVNENENNNSNITVNVRGARSKYGKYDNVLLSEDEFRLIKEEYPNDFSDRIDNLSEYIAKTGKSYSNHLAVIRSWAKQDAEKTHAGAKAPSKRNSFNSHEQQEYDFDALEKTFDSI
jgi:hypothetical protein